MVKFCSGVRGGCCGEGDSCSAQEWGEGEVVKFCSGVRGGCCGDGDSGSVQE